ncbi:Predicted dithiol-disulfide isomerase, DsbA family [Pseudoxanthomonas sp. GM95]|uniref:DsbA family oxidoreductase n=1 Tax=Pseudoxanthomonas sp. GM95 TaxID=1881043 RepID=UPI0008D63B6C|nr:DsbA family oxidoreductase [Pseudoxanthomonas sp. GM95]SEM08006.1 Predicted dithiol-disulfide isomerase, DsbA family [Pseudoxanthomonas sp. GM95]
MGDLSTSPSAGQPVRVDFVSDVVCPWCAIGLQSLLTAAERIEGLQLDLHFQPFELDPELGAGGEDLQQRLMRKYGMSAAQYKASGETIRARGAELGFTFDLDKRTRSFNTFNAHRLLHWAGELGAPAQLRLKRALLEAYFTEGLDVSDHAQLVAIVATAGLEAAQAQTVLESDQYVEQVRQDEARWRQAGITAVPSVVFNQQHLLQGGQPVETFEQALRQLSGIAAA